ncbi:MAG: radical SAM protein [Candidatus Bathyarchaeia archaeon]
MGQSLEVCPLSYGEGEITGEKCKKILRDLLNPAAGVYTPIKFLFHDENVKKVLRGDFYSVTPVTAQIVPTLQCNFRCPRCTYGQIKMELMKSCKKIQMSYKELCLIIDRLCEGGIKGVVFTGGGEPTCYRHLPDGIKYAKEKKLEVGLFTNGSLLTDKKS